MPAPLAPTAVQVLDALSATPHRGVLVSDWTGITTTLAVRERTKLAWEPPPPVTVTLPDGRTAVWTCDGYQVRVTRPVREPVEFDEPDPVLVWVGKDAGSHRFEVRSVGTYQA